MKLLRISVITLVLVAQHARGAESAIDPWLGLQVDGRPTADAQQAASIARATTGGRVLDVRPQQGESGNAYRVRLLLDPGRVRTIIVDADSGLIR